MKYSEQGEKFLMLSDLEVYVGIWWIQFYFKTCKDTI